jgi:ferrous iron transport protein A
MKTLKEVKVGDTVTVVRLHGRVLVKRRIMDMESQKTLKSSPQSGAARRPVEVSVRDMSSPSARPMPK